MENDTIIFAILNKLPLLNKPRTPTSQMCLKLISPRWSFIVDLCYLLVVRLAEYGSTKSKYIAACEKKNRIIPFSDSERLWTLHFWQMYAFVVIIQQNLWY